MAAALLLSAPVPAAAEFRYAEPPPGLLDVEEVRHAEPTALVVAVRRLAGPETVVRFDRRVDAARRISRPESDWRPILWAAGLDWTEHGDELHVFPAGLPQEELQLVSALGGAAVWRIEAGEWLRGVVARWAARAGANLVVRTDRRYRFEESREMTGTFGGALDRLAASLAHLDRPPAFAVAEDGSAVTVTHRPAPATGGMAPAAVDD